jgi:hypothetical protein
MDNNLTIDALTFAMAFNGPTGSKRINASRGANLPDVLTVRRQPYVDSQTKLAGIRTAVVLERHLALTQNAGIIAPLRIQVVVAGPTDTGIASSDYDAVVNQMFNLLCGTTNTNGLDLKNEIFVGGQQ